MIDEIHDLQVELETLSDYLEDARVDNEILLDYVTFLELKYEGKLTNGRLPFFDDEMKVPEP